ncbi:TetR/AcrR family transcriptional regulator [Parvularcula sp. IMCC14364]|uniref:TetR/AcrR family transcriptional regulator n=1 Tax=Parvularcula sp. IMCC14364 TaxID=3067902 RepID=UPI0027428E25|nr:TetR family transcriptional regulator [Parvularcula sp. IMCC14364]
MPRVNLSESEARTLILDKARELFLDIGYNKTTVADIARACGFSSANVHRLFGTKGAINEAIAERMLTEKLQDVRSAIARETTARGKLVAALSTVHQSTLETFTEKKRVHDMVACAIDERWQAIRRYRVALLDITRSIVREGMESGEFQVDDLEAAAMGVHMSIFRLCHPVLVVEMLGEPDEGHMDTHIDFILKALGATRAGQVKHSAIAE